MFFKFKTERQTVKAENLSEMLENDIKIFARPKHLTLSILFFLCIYM